MSKNKFKVLCLHGFTQNATVFHKSTSKIRGSLNHLVDFVYINAPHHIVTSKVINEDTFSNDKVSEEHKPYGWWYTPKDKSFEDKCFIGYKESVAFIRQTLIEKGPFDGILGFSQGASFAAILTELLEKQSPEFCHHDPLKFSILVSGFRPNLQEAPNWLLTKKQGLKTPTLHYIGDSDTWVSPEKSFALTQLFENPVIFRHSGGHYLPYTPASQEAFAQFLHLIKPMSH